MAVIYATLIVKGVKTYAQVPGLIKDQVRQVLIDLECDHSKEEMQEKLDVFFAVGRLTQAEYEELTALLQQENYNQEEEID